MKKTAQRINTGNISMSSSVKFILVAAIFFGQGALFSHFLFPNNVQDVAPATAAQTIAEQSIKAPEKMQHSTASVDPSTTLLKSVAQQIANDMTPAEAIEQIRFRDPETAFELMNEYLTGEEWKRSFYAIFPDYAYRNVHAAAEIIKTLENRELRAFALLGLAEQWSLLDAREAFQWIGTLGDDPLVDQAYYTVMRGFAFQAPEEAASIVAALESSGMKDELISEVAGVWASQDAGKALNWIQQLSETGVDVYGAEGQVLEAWAETEPAAAFDYVLAKDATNYNRVDSVFESYAKSSPEQAAAIVTSLPEQSQDLAAESVARHWLRQDQERATKWIAALPAGMARDCAVRETAQFYMENHPEHAFAWAAFVDKPEERLSLMSDVVRQWCSKDQQLAEQAIRTAQLTNEERTQLMSVYAKIVDSQKPIDLIIPGA